MRKVGTQYYKFFFFGFLFLSKLTWAQQGNVWYFGDHAGLNFNTTPPTALTNGQLNTLEGCSSISDNAGRILFYTDGSIIYDSTHQPMPNGSGLLGHYSSAQSATIIPKPGSTTIYYVFTADEYNIGFSNGYNYNIVDMSLNGGRGDVVLKNVPLFNPGTERLNGIRHSNGIDIWVLAKKRASNEFRAYRLDCNGLNTTPVVSTAGYVVSSSGYEDGGLFKFSPDGKKLCQTFGISSGIIELYDFDDITGMVSNPIRWSPSPLFTGNNNIAVVYTFVEFSPDSKLLYTSSSDYNGNTNTRNLTLQQYDISSNSLPAILASKVMIKQEIASPSPLTFGGIQLGPDKKIYFSQKANVPKLSVIANPNNPGLSCNFQENGIDLSGRNAFLGLPNFIPNYFVNRTADFDYLVNSDCATVNFSGFTTLPAPVQWQWDFGDGNTSNVQNPVHVYSSVGNLFNVTLRIISPNACGGEALIIKTINLNRIIPKAGFQFQSQCGSFTVNFFDTSTINGGTINYRLWDFGDATTSTAQNPVHTYLSTGNYTVKLTVGNVTTCGGFDTVSKVVSIETQPLADFNFSGGCSGSPVQFSDQSTITFGNIDLWQWDFGDATTSSLQNPQHTYSSPNTYTIKLKVRSQTGCWSLETPKTITLSPKPFANFGWQNTCVNLPTIFKDSSTITAGSINRWYWNFGDGNTSTSQDPQHTYTIPGVYNIKFVAGTTNNCNSDTLTKTITIGSKPMPAFNNTYQCGIKNINFTDASTNTTGTINNWHWNFGDGNTSGIQNPTHLFTAYGSYTVKLAVSSNLGCISDTTIKTIAVDAKPTAGFTVNGGCVNQLILFSGTAAVEAGTISSWYWNFGDATSANTQNTNHIYSSTGQYLVKFTAKATNNCISDTVFKTIPIDDKPVAGFSIQNGCVGSPIVLQNNSTIGYGSINSYYWDFGNGNTSANRLPVFSYSNFGNYSVKLTVASGIGCQADTVTNPVNIESNPRVDFNFDAACAGKPINFINLSSNNFGTINQWKWDFGNGATSTAYQPVYTYNFYSNFALKLTATTGNGCVGNKTKNISIKKINVFAGNDTIIAIGQPLELHASGANDYVWTPGIYLNNNTLPDPVAVLSKDHTYYLRGTTTEGCIGFDTIKIKVYKGPDIYVPNAFTPNNDNLNDKLIPIIPGALTLDYFSIFNRYGQLIYITKRIGEGWDGRWQNIPQSPGTYVWICRVTDYKGNIIEKKGTVIYIR